MVKTYGPLFSLDASGTLANAITFSKWKGRNYVRQRVIPANPKSALQVAMRAMLKFTSQAWASIGSTPQGSWTTRADAKIVSPFNAYVGHNQSRWREFQAPGSSDPVPETGTEPVATLDSATGGEKHVDLEFTVTTLNDVWGVAIFRSPTGTFTPSIANCIAVISVDSTGTLVYTDSGLDAGDYYYDAKFFTKDGLFAAEEGEQMGTAT